MDIGSTGSNPPEAIKPKSPLITLDTFDPRVGQYIIQRCEVRLAYFRDWLFELSQAPDHADTDKQRRQEWFALAMIDFYETIINGEPETKS
jgi:hypothetical protein